MTSTRREFCKTIGATGLGVFFANATRAADPAKRPNILFIFSDDHASHAISAYGSKINKTPNLDRIARDGALFENCFCTNSICAPSRAVVMTGKFNHLNGVIDNRRTFDGEQWNYAKELQKAGYTTAMIGKWHLKSAPTGFDFWHVLPGQGSYYNPDFRTPDGNKRYEGYTTDIIADLTLDWLKNQRDTSKPFLIHSWHKAPHRNWMPGPAHLKTYDDTTIPEPPTLFDDYSGRTSSASKHAMGIDKHMSMAGDLKVTPALSEGKKGGRGGYGRLTPEQRKTWDAAYVPKNEKLHADNPEGQDLVRWKYQRYIKDYLRCIASVDDNVGRLLDYLEEAGLAENTIVVYSSDQGFYLGEHGWFDKRWMYEESLRMPLMMRWPGKVKPGTRIKEMVQNIDFAPTLLAAAGTAAPEGEVQGVDMAPLLTGSKPVDWRKSIYYHYYEFPGAHSVQRHYGVRTERHKLIYFYPVDEWELFDLEKDPMEMRSVYDDPTYASVVTELKAELARLREYYKDTDDDVVPAPKGPEPVPPFKHEVFQVGSQISSVKKANGGWLVSGPNDGGYLMKQLDKPFAESATLRCRITSKVSDGIQNGMIAFGSGKDPNQVVRAGIYIGAGSYVVLTDGVAPLANKSAKFAKDKTFDVTVKVDLKAAKMVLTVDGTDVPVDLPGKWDAIRFVGYGLNKTTTQFTELEIEGK